MRDLQKTFSPLLVLKLGNHRATKTVYAIAISYNSYILLMYYCTNPKLFIFTY